MADVNASTSVVSRSISGTDRVWTIDYTTVSGLTTGAATDTVATPFQVVNDARADFVWTTAVTGTTATFVSNVTPLSSGRVQWIHTTHDSRPIRLTIRGR